MVILNTMSKPNNLRTPVRFVTGHNADGTSIFETAISENPPTNNFSDDMQIAFCYGTQGFPIDVNDGKDIRVYEDLVQNPPGILVPDGSAARIVDFAPGYTTPMHRSMSLNYNVVIEGEVEVLLDSGESRILQRGDTLVQRAINHAWRNTSATEWARITAVVLPVQEFDVGGEDVKPSLSSPSEQEARKQDGHT
jgi:quercetin dioxygenase-like cupin family protein